nr:hypothetical protein [uncultured Draconibacterium sp.]
MKKTIFLIVLIGLNSAIYSQTKIGFNINDAFDVSGNSVAHYGMSRITGTGYHYVGLSGYFGLNFYTEGKERIKILRNGNVGIGTNSPKGKMDVLGMTYLRSAPTHSTISEQLRFGRKDQDIRYHSIYSNHTGSPKSNYIDFRIHTGNSSNLSEQKSVMVLTGEGNVGIGTSDTKGFKLGVKGQIAAEEVKVTFYDNWSDFVFYDDYNLPTLKEVEKHIKEKGHLKDIPSAKEVEENGILLGKMDSKLLQKIEELTLYTIQQEKKIRKQAEKINRLELLNKKLFDLQERFEKLEKKCRVGKGEFHP